MVRKALFSFDNVTQTGIIDVPINNLVIIEDSDGNGASMLLVLKDKTGFDANTTIANLLITDQYREIITNDTQTVTDFDATASQTIFSTTYSINSNDVYIGGIKLKPQEYDSSSGTQIEVFQPVEEGTWVQVVSSSDSPALDVDWSTVANTPTTLSGYGITDNIVLDSDIGSTVQAFDSTILKSANIGTSVQAYDVDTVKKDLDTTFTGNLRTSSHSDDNNIDFTLSNNISLTATATSMGTATTTGCTGQSGYITITTAENITGWDAKYVFKTTPVGLTGVERFGYFVESESIIAIWVIV